MGDHVIVEKAGEIIPQVVEVVKEKRATQLDEFKFPDSCPTCQSSLIRIEGEAVWRCTNQNCSDQLKEGSNISQVVGAWISKIWKRLLDSWWILKKFPNLMIFII